MRNGVPRTASGTNAHPSVIASEAKQSSTGSQSGRLDCFVACAPRNDGPVRCQNAMRTPPLAVPMRLWSDIAALDRAEHRDVPAGVVVEAGAEHGADGA